MTAVVPDRGRRPRLIATDLDGTLLHDDGTVTERTARALAQIAAAGIDLVLVTARPPRWVEHLTCLPEHGVVICVNGAVVYDVARSRVLEHRALDDDVVRALVAEIRAAVPDATFAAERPTGFATEHAYRGHHPVPPDVVRTARIEDALDGATVKLLVRSPGTPDGRVHDVVDRVLAGRAVALDSGAAGLVEVHHPAVSKAAALERWAAARGIGAQDVWAFGDMPNDLAMLAWAGRSFAVANAHPSVRAAADEVCGANTDDGVAAVLESLLA
jgi:HAD superfamily hydrolase (TIGR01484 family)